MKSHHSALGNPAVASVPARATRRSTACAIYIALLIACGGEESGSSNTVSVESGKVTVDVDPFSIRIEDAEGRVVLETLRRTDSVGGTLYAPVGFVTGDDPELRYPVLEGLSAPPDPTPPNPVDPGYHSAAGVQSIAVEGDSLVVLLETDDPQARSVELRVAPDDAGTVALAVSVDDPTGVSGVFASFASSDREAFHGFGGRRESTDLRGRS